MGRRLGKRLASGALVLGALTMTSAVSAQPAAASSSCQLAMVHDEHWEAHVTCSSSRAGAVIAAFVVYGDDGWLGDQWLHSICCLASLNIPANGGFIIVGDDFSFNEDAALPYDNDEIYVHVAMVDPSTGAEWAVDTNTVSGDFS